MPDSEDNPVRYAEHDADGKFIPPFPVDPVELTEETRNAVCKEVDGVPLRKYTNIYKAGVYGGIATAYSVGCNYRCVFCWVDWSRDWPELYGEFYSPTEVYSKLREVMTKAGVKRARISGAEPTLCPDHLCGVLELVHRDRKDFDLFVIETNGVVLAQDESFAPRLAKYASTSSDTVGHVRISIRGGHPEPFEEKTGISKEFMELPFIAVRRLWDAGVSFHVAVVIDERFTTVEEKETIYRKLADIDPSVRRGVEEEFLDPYPHAMVRLRAVGREDVVGDHISKKEEAVLKRRPPL